MYYCTNIHTHIILYIYYIICIRKFFGSVYSVVYTAVLEPLVIGAPVTVIEVGGNVENVFAITYPCCCVHCTCQILPCSY